MERGKKMIFDLSQYFNDNELVTRKSVGEREDNSKLLRYEEVCEIVGKLLDEIERKESIGKEEILLERQKKAILGVEEEVGYYKNRIRDLIQNCRFGQEWFPSWYENLEDAIYHDLLGFAGLAPWLENRNAQFANSSSAKIIGDRIYFLIDGRMELQPQTIKEDRRRQLRAALLLATPEKRMTEVNQEVYLLDGTRVTLYNDGLVKSGQDCMVFRKFLVREYTFEQQAQKHTIPVDAIDLFQSMVKIGYNVAFLGPVRSAKTTFLTTWQQNEDPCLEGVMIESDPEIPLHRLMPTAPILQFIPSEKDFPSIVKKVMRSDADYIIMAEARDSVALHTAVKAANKGTRRVKMTYHTSDALDFCLDVADEILSTYSGDLGSTIIKVAKSFQYLFQFIQLPVKSEKRLKAIWEVTFDPENRDITMDQICKYRFETDDWIWANHISEDKIAIGVEEDGQALKCFQRELKKLAQKYPMREQNVFHPFYNQLIQRRG